MLVSSSVFWREAAAVTSGPLGDALSPAAKADGETVLENLEQHDVAFFRERTIRMGESDRWQRLCAAEAAAFLMAQPAQFAAPLMISVGSGMLLPARSVSALRAVDVLHAGGDAAALENPRLADVLGRASAAGVTFTVRPERDLSRTRDVPAWWAYQALSDKTSVVSWNDTMIHEPLQNADQALAFAHFYPPAGMSVPLDGQEAADIEELHARGITFHGLGREDPEEISLYEAWRIVESGHRLALGVCGVRIDGAGTDDMRATAEKLTPYLNVRRDVLSRLDDASQRAYMRSLIRHQDEPTLRERAEVLVAIHERAKATRGLSEWEVRERVSELYDWLDGEMGRLANPQEQIRKLLGWVEACGPTAARSAAEFAWSTLSEMHPAPNDYKEALEIFDALLRGMGSVRAARDATQAVAVPVAGTTPEARLAAFQKMVAVSGREEAIPTYLAVAATARDGEIEVQARRYEALHAALVGALPKDAPLQETARTTFAFLDGGVRAGLFDSKTFDDALRDFVEVLVASGSVERARIHLLNAEQQRDNRVERGERDVIIGGIRVPVRR
ncbi:MAG: hypothetical protein FJX76_11345 [Armatimonadetes bacterium]|nr:hypothetical protein [Armatimonadota bacterium]